jgi:hypothetical protein
MVLTHVLKAVAVKSSMLSQSHQKPVPRSRSVEVNW